MAKVYDMASKKEIVVQQDEWAMIGVHLEVRIASGRPVNAAINDMMLAGFDINQIRQYIGRVGIKDGERLEDTNKLYTEEENTSIREWLRGAPFKPQGESEQFTEASNRVAEIVLFPVRTELPQWATIYHGKVRTSRIHQLKVLRQRDGLLTPSFLFQINWADSGPGFSWPESYYLTYLPVYNIFVLTMSQESDDVHGYNDLALAAIQPKSGQYLPWQGALDAIREWWREQRDDCSQGPWESLWNPGQYNPYELEQIRDELWKDYSC